MSQLSARFQVSPNEVRRGVMDYTAQLATGEVITAIMANVTPLGNAPVSPAFVITNLAIGPSPAEQVVFYTSGGADGFSYEVQFLATTSVGQVFEDIVQFDVRAKL